jgi:hypothetical protein
MQAGELNPEVYQRRTKVCELLLYGWPPAQVAGLLQLSRDTVCHDVNALRQTWADELKQERLQLIAAAFAKLEALELELRAKGEWKHLLKTIELRLKVLGAFKPDVVVVAPQQIPWNEMLAGDSHQQLEQKLKEVSDDAVRTEGVDGEDGAAGSAGTADAGGSNGQEVR